MKDTRYRTTGGKILREIGILKGRGSDRFTSGGRHVGRYLILGITVHTVSPVICEMVQMGVVRHFGMGTNGTQIRFKHLRCLAFGAARKLPIDMVAQ